MARRARARRHSGAVPSDARIHARRHLQHGKSVTPEEVAADGADVLGNTFHLSSGRAPRSSASTVVCTVHELAGADPDDSGGFQVFSLANMRKLSEEGPFPVSDQRRRRSADARTIDGGATRSERRRN